MKEYTFEGRTQEEALLKASEKLGLNIRDMNYEVTEQESRMFGLVKKVVVRVRVPDEFQLPQEPEETVVEEEESSDAEQNVPQTLAKIGNRVEDVLGQILGLMGMDAGFSIEETDNEVMIDIYGTDIEYLIGKDGKVLTSLQFVVNRIVNRKAEVRKHVLIDAEGYKEKRDERLQEKAVGMAIKAVEKGDVVRMGPMNARERRIVHMALKDRDDVTTRSEGNGSTRRVAIIPRNRKRRNGDKKRGRKQERQPRVSANGNVAKD